MDKHVELIVPRYRRRLCFALALFTCGACHDTADTRDVQSALQTIQTGYANVYEVVTDTRDSMHARVTGALRLEKPG